MLDDIPASSFCLPDRSLHPVPRRHRACYPDGKGLGRSNRSASIFDPLLEVNWPSSIDSTCILSLPLSPIRSPPPSLERTPGGLHRAISVQIIDRVVHTVEFHARGWDEAPRRRVTLIEWRGLREPYKRNVCFDQRPSAEKKKHQFGRWCTTIHHKTIRPPSIFLMHREERDESL